MRIVLHGGQLWGVSGSQGVLVWFWKIRGVPGTPDGFEGRWDATGRGPIYSGDKVSARVSAQVSAQVGHLIGDGLGACPVASIGLRGFRVYIGVYQGVSKPLTILGRAGTLWSADRPGRVFVVSPQWHSSSYCVGTGCTYFVAGSQHLSEA